MRMRDDVFDDCVEHWKNSTGTTPFWSELAEKWGYKNGEKLRWAFKEEKNRRGIGSKESVNPASGQTSYSETDEYINIVCSSKRIRTKEDIIKEFKIDEEIWKLEKFIVRTDEAWRKDKQADLEVVDGKWTGTSKDSGKILLVPLTRIEARFVRKTLEHITLDEIETMFSKKEFSIPNFTKKVYEPSDEILEIDITDLHLGSDANHAPEKRVKKAIDDVISRTGGRNFQKIVLAVLGDIFHYDTATKTTSAGTIVTTNGMTVYQVFDLGLTTLIDVIINLLGVAEVEVIFIPGNHDRASSYSLMKTVEAYFRNNENVTFDCSHSSRKFMLHGVSLIGWMHGDIPKARASEWLQVEAREEWGKAKYCEIHSGNFHSQHVPPESGGVILRYLPGLTDVDEWHYQKGFVGAVRALQSFVWHKDLGLREMWFTNV